jgi:hypothetical protein
MRKKTRTIIGEIKEIIIINRIIDGITIQKMMIILFSIEIQSLKFNRITNLRHNQCYNLKISKLFKR